MSSRRSCPAMGELQATPRPAIAIASPSRPFRHLESRPCPASSPSIRERAALARSSSTSGAAGSARRRRSSRNTSRSRAGSSTTPTRSGRRVVHRSGEALRAAGVDACRHRGHRHHEPARDDLALGARHRKARAQRDRLAGSAHRRALRGAAAGGHEPRVRVADRSRARSRTFPGSKLAWLLDNVPGARKKAAAGRLAAGTIDSWLVWKLTGGRRHVTDVTNASRTLLMDLRRGRWDEELCRALRVPASVLPEIVPSGGRIARDGCGRPRRGDSRRRDRSAISRRPSSASSARGPGSSSARTARAASSSCSRARSPR